MAGFRDKLSWHIGYPAEASASGYHGRMSGQLRNWAGNLTYRAARVHHPTSIEQVQAIVRAGHKLRVLGARHSFNAIADCDHDLIALERIEPWIAFDHARRTVTVNASLTYGQLCPHLHRAGVAVHNLASLPHISVAGAIATATHGSGDANGNLATAVAAIELVTADGERVTISREADGERFNGAIVSLGALGVVTRVTLDVQPAFTMRQIVYEGLPLAQLETHFDAILSSAYSVSLFTDWQHERINQVWLKQRLDGEDPPPIEPVFFGATPATQPHHPVATLSAEPCTPQLGRPVPWHECLPHFRMDHMPSAGEELQSEYFVPRRYALAALRAVAALGPHIGPHLLISEIRSIAADALWMSPCYRQACIGIHFTWKRDWPAVQALLPRIEAALAPFEPRPHWGKMFTLPAAAVHARYPRLNDFRRLMQAYDPLGKFRNAFVETFC